MKNNNNKKIFGHETRFNIFAIPLVMLFIAIPITLGAIYLSPENSIEHIYSSLIVFGCVSIILIIGFCFSIFSDEVITITGDDLS